MPDEPKTEGQRGEDVQMQAEESTTKAVRQERFAKLSKKNKLLTHSVLKVVGGLNRGGWDGNHNEIFV